MQVKSLVERRAEVQWIKRNCFNAEIMLSFHRAICTLINSWMSACILCGRTNARVPIEAFTECSFTVYPAGNGYLVKHQGDKGGEERNRPPISHTDGPG